VRPKGATALGTRAEIKNLNSFRHVARAIEHEVARQVALVESGHAVEQETRLWNAERGETVSMRSKEDAHDYRYFPEPDLQPLAVGPAWTAEVRASLPELPAERRRRFVTQYALPDYDAGVLTQERELADYFEAAASQSGQPKLCSNWIMTELLRKLKQDTRPLAQAPIGAPALAGLVKLVAAGSISGKTAKDVFERMWETGEPAAAIVERLGLAQLDDAGALQAAVAEVVAASPDQVASYRGGKAAALGWFVGQVMSRTGGRANPRLVGELLKKALGGP
jgi:aspartyl-tRNA(Asn)/glutamyl-tRNA(Gln) amidotransferase subunit B